MKIMYYVISACLGAAMALAIAGIALTVIQDHLNAPYVIIVAAMVCLLAALCGMAADMRVGIVNEDRRASVTNVQDAEEKQGVTND